MRKAPGTNFAGPGRPYGALTLPPPAWPMPRLTFSTAQEMALRLTWSAHGEAQCPVCRVPLEARAIPRPAEVSYVRTLSWLTCVQCGRTVVADDPKTGR